MSIKVIYSVVKYIHVSYTLLLYACTNFQVTMHAQCRVMSSKRIYAMSHLGGRSTGIFGPQVMGVLRGIMSLMAPWWRIWGRGGGGGGHTTAVSSVK